METNINYESYNRARKQVKKIKGFYSHLIIFCMVVLVLAIINLKYTPGYLWFLWNVSGWGIGVIFHGMSVFNLTPFFNKEWENRKIKQFTDEEINKNNTIKFK